MAQRLTARSLLALIVFIIAQGCTSSSDAPRSGSNGEAADQRQLTLAVIPKSTGGEFWETVEMGARQAAEEYGVAIKWEGAAVETDLAEQNKIIENMVNLGVDGMALAPLNNRTLKARVERVVAVGVPVVIFDSPVDGHAHVSYVGTDNLAGGRLGAQYMIDHLRNRGKKVFVLRYIEGTASTEQRMDGFVMAAKEAGLQIVADPYSEDATVAGGIKAASNSLSRFITGGKLQLDGIFATNLFSTLGMVAALDDLRSSGVEIDVVFVGFDTSPKLIEEVEQGHIDALVAQDPRRIGYLAVETLTKHLRGEKIEPVIDTGAKLITRESIHNDLEIRQLMGLE